MYGFFKDWRTKVIFSYAVLYDHIANKFSGGTLLDDFGKVLPILL